MEDIFSDDNTNGTSYIMHKNADKTWYSNEKAITLDKIMVCPDTIKTCLLYTSPSPRDVEESRMPSSA